MAVTVVLPLSDTWQTPVLHPAPDQLSKSKSILGVAERVKEVPVTDAIEQFELGLEQTKVGES